MRDSRVLCTYYVMLLRRGFVEKTVRTVPANFKKSLRKIYVITPTKTRLAQKADLTRLANTLQLVPNLHWILVEDANKRSPVIRHLSHITSLRRGAKLRIPLDGSELCDQVKSDFLNQTCLLSYTHLAVPKNLSLVKGEIVSHLHSLAR